MIGRIAAAGFLMLAAVAPASADPTSEATIAALTKSPPAPRATRAKRFTSARFSSAGPGLTTPALERLRMA